MKNRKICVALKRYKKSPEYWHLEALKCGFRGFGKANRGKAIVAAARGQEVYKDGDIFKKKRHLHQRRLLSSAGDWAARRILRDKRLKTARSFSDLLEITHSVHVEARDWLFLKADSRSYKRGGQIGPLWAYDVALRLTFALNKDKPNDKIYVQRGSEAGARALNLGIYKDNALNHFYICRRELCRSMRSLGSEHVENFLCLYERYLQPRNETAAEGSVRSKARC